MRRKLAAFCAVGFVVMWVLGWFVEREVIAGIAPSCAETVSILIKGRDFEVCLRTAILYWVGSYGCLFLGGAAVIIRARDRYK